MHTQEREHLRREMHGDLDRTINARIDRFFEVRHQGIGPAHHFAPAAAECVSLYRDGYFLSAVMVSQAVNEGIWKFVLERNDMKQDENMPTRAPELVQRGIISQACADAMIGIWRSFRNDLHHMNPKVRDVPMPLLAKKNIARLSAIEQEIFGVSVGEPGTLMPNHPKYWDVGEDGTVAVFVQHPVADEGGIRRRQ